MNTYSQFAPSNFDTRGLGLRDRQEWLVLPCAHNRDSDVLEESNFRVAIQRLGGESEDVEVHRFGHWACGYFEIILVRPGTTANLIALLIEAKLKDYPILDEDDFSAEELTRGIET